MNSPSIVVTKDLAAPREKVWAALTTAEGWTSWFSQAVHGVFAEGETLALEFSADCLCYAVITEMSPKDAFAYRWHPGEDCPVDRYPESEMTDVRFELTDLPGGTRLTLTESGFERIPEDRRPMALKNNTEGWHEELAKLEPLMGVL